MGKAGAMYGRGCLPALLDVSLPATEEFLRRYPSEISVGQAQRVLIAMAILHRPASVNCRRTYQCAGCSDTV